MQSRDLGRLDAPVLLYGGPYSNAQATRALLDNADFHAIPVSHRICTGDVVAYGGAPLETVSLIQSRGGAVVAGNCERQLGAGADTCGCGFDAGTTCDLLSAGWYAHADAAMTPDIRAWMNTLPDIVVFQHLGLKTAVIHGGVTDIAKFLWPCSLDEMFHQELEALQTWVGPVDRVIAGHCGLPFERQIGDVHWINAGVIGLPPHNGHPSTRYAILQNGQVTFHNLAYDIASAVAAMTQAGLTQGYHDTLRSGWWPSEDVLPLELRRPKAG